MKIRYILLLLTVASLLGSCAAPKVAYFTDLKPGMAEQVLNPLEIRVRPEDKISILVNSKDPLLMDLFNLPIISRQIGIRSEASNNQGMSGYTINKDGNIDFPVLGHIPCGGNDTRGDCLVHKRRVDLEKPRKRSGSNSGIHEPDRFRVG